MDPAAGKAGLRKVDRTVVKNAVWFEDLTGREIRVPKPLIPHWQEKPLSSILSPVPQTDTGR